MSRYVQSSNPFEDDEDDGDFVMVDKQSKKPSSNPRSPQGASGYARNQHWNASGETSSPFDDRRQRLMQQIHNSENTQLESTQRALASIYDSEAMGVATAEELLRQGETLNTVEKKMEVMQKDLTTSQKHINNIKSVFGGIRNWWSGDKKAEAEKPRNDDANSRLRNTVEKSEMQKTDYSGFYDDDKELDAKFMAKAKPGGSQQYAMISPITRSAREEEVDQNLQMMFHGMTRLKGLASGLGDEIERQNEQLDRINVKAEQTDDLLENQNMQMKRILRR